uniref:Uncharacterized protein n=1 Tax=Arundo donax TaxID=35708 RepID=A0A0A9CQU2_ARUDO
MPQIDCNMDVYLMRKHLILVLRVYHLSSFLMHFFP